MAKFKNEEIARVKAMGFLLNRGTELFSGRIVAPGTVFTAENFADMSYIAEHFGYTPDSLNPYLPKALHDTDTEKGYLTLLPTDKSDGFFMARLIKK